jgi:hypothetical protein
MLHQETTQEATTTWITAQVKTVDDQLLQLRSKRDTLVGQQQPTIPVVIGAHADSDTQSQSSGTGTGTDVAAPGAEYATPIFDTSGGPNANSGANPSAPTTDNPWTNLDLSFSAQDQKKSQDESS